MLSKLIIGQVIDSQKERLYKKDLGLARSVSGFENLTSHAFIITGIRRCGKSTLLQQIHRDMGINSIYLNFEDPRLSGFDLSDFNRLQEIAEIQDVSGYFFDEIQIIPQWENFVRFRLDEGYKMFVTGSNATMLSRELGTRLTGRHIQKELFPFSYPEFLDFTNQSPGVTSSADYLTKGGFPEFLKTGLPEMLMQIFNDIIIRDIALRYSIKNTGILSQLGVWLISNTGKLTTGNSLKKLFQIGSSSSIMEYLSYFAESYLFFFIPRFSYSGKVQLVNPKKIYCIDNGLVSKNAVSFSDDKGRLLENMFFMFLRRQSNEIYYFSGKKECDFVEFRQGKLKALYQVCWQLDRDNLDREFAGLSEAMDFFGINTGYIITHTQKETYTLKDKTIQVLPFHELSYTAKPPA